MTARAYLGLAEWGASAAGFYPEELPGEWREAYYATQLDCVWLSRASCRAIGQAEADRLLDDTMASFRFVFETGSDIPERLRERSVLSDGREIWFDAGTDLSALSGELRRQAESEKPLYLFSRDGNLDKLGQVRTLIELLGL